MQSSPGRGHCTREQAIDRRLDLITAALERIDQNSADIRDLSTHMAVLSRLEERVAALEKRTA